MPLEGVLKNNLADIQANHFFKQFLEGFVVRKLQSRWSSNHFYLLSLFRQFIPIAVNCADECAPVSNRTLATISTRHVG